MFLFNGKLKKKVVELETRIRTLETNAGFTQLDISDVRRLLKQYGLTLEGLKRNVDNLNKS